jgi:hypothetical protein
MEAAAAHLGDSLEELLVFAHFIWIVTAVLRNRDETSKIEMLQRGYPSGVTPLSRRVKRSTEANRSDLPRHAAHSTLSRPRPSSLSASS